VIINRALNHTSPMHFTQGNRKNQTPYKLPSCDNNILAIYTISVCWWLL